MAEKFYHPDVPADLAPMFEKLADALSDALALIVDPGNDHGGDVYTYVLIGMAVFFTLAPIDDVAMRMIADKFYREMKAASKSPAKDIVQ